MKKLNILIITLLAANAFNAQVAIGKTGITNESVLLEFGTEAKGIILPSVTSAPGAFGGTFIFNTVSKSVQVLQGGSWTNLTDEDKGVLHPFTNAGTDIGNGVIIGANTTNKPGVLVLESTKKAMVLPQVANPHLTMKGAIAGTVVYDTAADMLAVYDGANWSYWK